MMILYWVIILLGLNDELWDELHLEKTDVE